jgi:hypothetical protein
MYARAYRKGADALRQFRDRAIEREIGKTYTEGAQLAFLFNKDTCPEEFAEYQKFRVQCKAKVDVEIAILSAELNEKLK